MKSGNSSGKAGSANRFDILTSLNDRNDNVIRDSALVMDDELIVDEEEVFIEPKKSRAAATGVAELMRNLKPKRKGPFDKGKNKGVKVGSATLGCSSNHSS